MHLRFAPLVAAATVALAACKNPPPPAAQPTPSANAPAAPTTPQTAPAPPPPPAAEGPAQQARTAAYTLSVNVQPPNAGAPGRFVVELHGNGEYHVNEQYPIAVEASVENGAMPKTSLRRADANPFTQAVARFEQPLTSTGAGTRVTGTVRFGVCRAEQCAFHTAPFAVRL